MILTETWWKILHRWKTSAWKMAHILLENCKNKTIVFYYTSIKLKSGIKQVSISTEGTEQLEL
jgi:hypothetical protein